MIRVLRLPGVGRLGAAGFMSGVTDWMLFIALPLFVLQLSGSALVTATVFALEAVPPALAGPFVGVLIDRYNPWRVMACVGIAQAMCLLPVLTVQSVDQLWLVYVVVAAKAVLGGVIEPGRAATAAALTPPADLIAVNQLLASLSSLARLIGGSLGGLALAIGGIDVVLLLAACSFFVTAGIFATGDRPWPSRRRGAPTAGWMASYVEGLRGVASSRVLRRIMAIAGCMALAQGAFTVLFVLFVLRKLGGDEADVGVLRGVQAVGALAGTASFGLLARRFGPGGLVAGSLMVFGGLSLLVWNAPAATRAFGLYVGLFISIGVPGVLSLTGLTTLLQTNAPPELRGRVLSSFFAVLTGVQAAGMLLAGALGAGDGLDVALQVQASLYLVAGMLALRLRVSDNPPSPRQPGRPWARRVAAGRIGSRAST